MSPLILALKWILQRTLKSSNLVQTKLACCPLCPKMRLHASLEHIAGLLRILHMQAADINALFGFRLECIERLGEAQGIFAWNRINSMFNWLPLAALIEDRIICMHGGGYPLYIPRHHPFTSSNFTCSPQKPRLCEDLTPNCPYPRCLFGLVDLNG